MFGHVITAMVTPFSDTGHVDYDEALRLANHLIDHGSDSLVLCGTTGESPTLTHDEEIKLFDCIIKGVNGRAKILAGTGSNCTRTAIEMTKKAAALGADGTLQVTPYYNKPTQAGLIAHFKALHDACELPIVIYNIPGRSVVDMSPETMGELAQLPRIIGVKDATGDLARVSREAEPADGPRASKVYALPQALSVGFGDGGTFSGRLLGVPLGRRRVAALRRAFI